MSPDVVFTSSGAVGLFASPGGGASRSRLLVQRALGELRGRSIETVTVDLAALPADALLGRGRDGALERAIADVTSARILVVGTPVYRASYSGLLKVFFDLLPEGSLADTIAIPIVSGGSPGHLLAIDHALRPLLTSLGATVVPSGVYASPSSFVDGTPGGPLLDRVGRAVREAVALAAAIAFRPDSLPLER